MENLDKQEGKIVSKSKMRIKNNIELELIQPKEMAQTLYASTGEIKQSTKELFEAISKL